MAEFTGLIAENTQATRNASESSMVLRSVLSNVSRITDDNLNEALGDAAPTIQELRDFIAQDGMTAVLNDLFDAAGRDTWEFEGIFTDIHRCRGA